MTMTSVDYVLVDRDSGEIEVSGTCQALDLDAQQLADHQTKIIGRGARATHYLGPGGLTKYTPEQQAEKARQPPHCRWDNVLMRWIDARPLADLRAACWAGIKEARTRAADSPIDTPFGRLDACPSSRAALAAAGAAAPVEWTTADNAVVQLDADALAQVLRLIGRRTQSCHSVAQALRARIEAAVTVEALDAINWPEALG